MSHNFTMPHKFLMQHLKRCPNVVHKPSVPDNNDQTHQAFMEFKEIYTSLHWQLRSLQVEKPINPIMLMFMCWPHCILLCVLRNGYHLDKGDDHSDSLDLQFDMSDFVISWQFSSAFVFLLLKWVYVNLG